MKTKEGRNKRKESNEAKRDEVWNVGFSYIFMFIFYCFLLLFFFLPVRCCPVSVSLSSIQLKTMKEFNSKSTGRVGGWKLECHELPLPIFPSFKQHETRTIMMAWENASKDKCHLNSVRIPEQRNIIQRNIEKYFFINIYSTSCVFEGQIF